MINLVPPVINTYAKPFLIDGDDENKKICKIYFSISIYNTLTNIKNVQVSIRNQYTNLSVLNKDKYPSEIMISALQTDTDKTTDDKYYIEITNADLKEDFQINQYYKVQLRFTNTEASDPSTEYIILPDGSTSQAIDSWLVNNVDKFSEWSTICLTRGISTPDLHISGFDLSSGHISWSLANNTIIGTLKFLNPLEKDFLKSYQIKLYSNNVLLSNSNKIFINNYNSPNTFEYNVKYNFIAGTTYTYSIHIITDLGYELTKAITFTVDAETIAAPDISLSAEQDFENGRNIIYLKRPTTADVFTGKILLRRTSNKSNFTIWDDILLKEYTNTTKIKEQWSDETIESGIWYKYCIQKIDENQNRGTIKMIKDPLMMTFEYDYLTTSTQQLKLKYNSSISSFKRIIKETKTETIGSKYPFIRRNAYTDYIQFSLGGTISSNSDEDDLFISKEKIYKDSIGLYEEYNEEQNIYTRYYDKMYEKAFRENVIDFLCNDDIKLFRSRTEGNFIIKLMDPSFMPNQTLDREIWDFSATALEIDENTVDNLKKYKLMKEDVKDE